MNQSRGGAQDGQFVPQLVLLGTNVALLEKLKPFSMHMPYISYASGIAIRVAVEAKLDALWLSLMEGVELYGAVPPFPLHEAQVLKTPSPRRSEGFPRYGIVGVAVDERDPKTPQYALSVTMRSLLRAVRAFNSSGEDPITRVGVLPEDLVLEKLPPEEAFRIIREAVHAG